MRPAAEKRPLSENNILSIRTDGMYWLDRARKTRDPKRCVDRVLFYRKALDVQSDPAILLELAQVYCDMQCFDAADSCILRALRVNPSLGEGWYLLGRTALARGDEVTSQNAFDRCMRCAPASPSANKAQEMLAGYAWKRSYPIPRMGFRAACLSRLADRADRPLERFLLLLASVRRSPSPEILLKFLSLCLIRSPSLVLHLLPAVLKRKGPLFDSLLLGAKARFLMGKSPLPCLQAAVPHARSMAQIQQLFRAGLFCRVPAWTLSALEKMLQSAPCSAELYEMCAACAARLNRPAESARFKKEQDRIHPDHNTQKAPGAPDPSALALSEMAVYRNRLRIGPLNRLLHLMVFSLKEVCSTRDVYSILIPLYQGLSGGARRQIESTQARAWRRAFAVCVCIRAGKPSAALGMLLEEDSRRAVMRRIRRLDRGLWMRANLLLRQRFSDPGNHHGRFFDEMHQF